MQVFPTGREQPSIAPHAAEAGGLSVSALAHELNSLLDGSMRHLRLADRTIDGLDAVDGDPLRSVQSRLRVAEAALQDMARVLARVMDGARVDGDALRSPRTIGEEVEHLMAALRPSAERQSVTLSASIDAAAFAMPAGVLGAVIMNALRNAIEACAEAPGESQRVETTIRTLAADDLVQIVVEDTGPGVPDGVIEPRGYGLGLETCRTLVDSLGGSLELRNADEGRGAVLEVRVPRGSLTVDG
jgi:signal transduction histidine kinase